MPRYKRTENWVMLILAPHEMKDEELQFGNIHYPLELGIVLSLTRESRKGSSQVQVAQQRLNGCLYGLVMSLNLATT